MEFIEWGVEKDVDYNTSIVNEEVQTNMVHNINKSNGDNYLNEIGDALWF